MLKQVKNTLIATSVIYFIIGLIMILFPGQVSDLICYLVSLMFLFFAVAGIVIYVKTEIKTPFFSTLLVLAIILGAFGIYILLNPRSFAKIIPLVMGMFLVVDSISKLSMAFDFKKMGYKNWWYMLIIACLVLSFGLILLFDPFGFVKAGLMVVGIMLVVDSITNIITIYSYSKTKKEDKVVLDVDIK